MRSFRYLSWFLILMVLMMSSSCYGRIDEQTVKSKKTVYDISLWFIEGGLAGYYEDKDLKSIEEFVKKHGAYLPTSVAIEKYGYLARIRIGHFWIRGVVTCYSRINSNFVYEYWVIAMESTREEVPSEIFFLITKTKGMDKKRKIIHRTRKFFSSFVTPEGATIRFPMDNKMIYSLSPWRFPDAFKGTELEGIKIEINEDGKYVRKRIQ